MQRQITLFASAAFNADQTPAIVSDVQPTIVPSHTANAPSAKPEPAPAQPIVGIDAVRAITEADAAERKAKAATLLAKRQAASATPSPSAKPINAKNAAKRVAAKPTVSASAKPAKPTAEARAKAQADQNDARRLARDVAGKAVSAFYTGRSLPFKAASDRFADINASNAKSPSARQAGLLLCLITYGAGNMQANGRFVRGQFRVPARLLNPSAKPGDTVLAQPESGCLGNMLGRAVTFVSGPRTGREQSTAIYQLNVKQAIAEIQATFGDKPANAAAKLLASFAPKAA